MPECEFCGEEFESDRKLHLHWGEEHEDELNSHKEDTVKKAEREFEEEKNKERERKKDLAFKGLVSVLALAVAGLVIPQMLSIGDGGSSNETASFNLDDQPMLGDPNASVAVVEFGDYKCPYCAMFEQQVLPQLKTNYIDTGEVKFYFLNYAFLDNTGDSSTTAAVAGECVYNQNETAFWDFHRSVYENQGPENQDWATADKLTEVARESTDGLDYDELNQCIQSQETIDQVRSDKTQGIDSGVTGTPTVYVNGEKASSFGYDGLKSLIDQELSD